jgi:hypothetical protein
MSRAFGSVNNSGNTVVDLEILCNFINKYVKCKFWVQELCNKCRVTKFQKRTNYRTKFSLQLL